MSALKFSSLSLCSQSERSALQLNFDQDVTILIGGNGFGKSAIMKSLYDTLGAKPYKIDNNWKSAQVTALLEFTVDAEPYSALKIGRTHVVFDASKNILVRTDHVSKELAPFLAEKFDFQLRMANKEEKVITPWPSYIFAPFYVDQDSSWNAAWKSFTDLILPHSPGNLADYHSGLKPNEYYVAKAKHDLVAADLRTLEAERTEIDATIRRLRSAIDAIAVDFDIAAFEIETNRLVAESQRLHVEQASFRRKLGELNEERSLWQEQEAVIHAALVEMNAELHEALHLDSDVECPMCGQHYHNKISDQFELVSDQDDLISSLTLARAKVTELNETISHQQSQVEAIESAALSVRTTLSSQRADITLQDVVRAEGKAEAARILRAQLAESDEKCGRASRLLEEAKAAMARYTNRERTKEIEAFFATRLREFEKALDVRADQNRKISIRAPKLARGSEGPRGLLAFYFAFLAAENKYGSSAFCPIVVDAPNQQGQDAGHLEAMMRFMLKNKPESAQLIVAAETMPIDADVDVQDISSSKDAVLRQSQYDDVSSYLRPYLNRLV